ncbi:hypothetical protein Emed_007083 [Eimeria media]
MSGLAPADGAAASADQEASGQRADGEVGAADRGMSEAEGRVGFAEEDVTSLSDGKDKMPEVDAGRGAGDAETEKMKGSRESSKDAARSGENAQFPDEGEEEVSHEGGDKEAGNQENDGSTKNGWRGSRKSTSASSSEKVRKSAGSSIKKGGKSGAPPFPMQQALLAIVVVIGLLLLSALRRGLSPPKRLPPEGPAPSLEGLPPQPAKPPKPAEPPVPRFRMPSWILAIKYNAKGIEGQRLTLASNLQELRQAWDRAPEEVKKSFAAKLELGEEGPPGALPDAQSPPEFETALSALLVPAALAQETPTPAPVEERIVFGRTLALLNASLNAAHVKLNLSIKLNKREADGRNAQRLQKGGWQKRKATSMVSAEKFVRMLGDAISLKPPGDEASKTPTVPKGLADDLARLVITTRLQTEAAERIKADFVEFWKDRQSLSSETKEYLTIPGGGQFLDYDFINLMNVYRTTNSMMALFVDAQVKELVKAFTREGAHEAFKMMSNRINTGTSSLSRKVNEASKEAKRKHAGALHQALLRLLQ